VLGGIGAGVLCVGGEIEDCLHLFTSEAVKHLDNFVDGEAVFQVFEDSGHWYTRSSEHPCATDFAGHAFNRRALRPIEWHLSLG
jgi:hypothetical protein